MKKYYNYFHIRDDYRELSAIQLKINSFNGMYKKLFLLTVCIISCFSAVFSQGRAQGNAVLSGKVIGLDDAALIGATVYLEEFGVGDDTDLSGSFMV